MYVRMLLVLCLAAVLKPAVAGDAEYAFRWNPAEGGPLDTAAVVTVLQLEAKKAKTYVVRYFDVVQSAKLPAEYKVVGRERGAPGEKPDATYKVRGPEPIPAALLAWKCPLIGDSEKKAEVDIGFEGPVELKRAFSVSCTVEAADLPSTLPLGYSAKAKGCSSQMQRTKARSIDADLKIEEWSLPTGARIIEVSMEGLDSADDLKRFRTSVVELLVDAKAVPLEGSKSELGSEC